MASGDKLTSRMKAVESLQRLYAAAEDCKTAYKKAGLPVPKEVGLLTTWGEEEVKAEAQEDKRPLLTIPPPYAVTEKGWVSVALADALPQTIVPAILRDYTDPLPISELLASLEKLGVDVNQGTVANIGTRLDHREHLIERSETGWQLVDHARAARISNGRLWGPPSAFQPPDLAAHRREAILAYLQEYGTLSRSQMITLLRQSEWVHAPVDAFLLRSDLVRLEGDKLIRRPKSDNPRNFDWELTKKKGQLRLANLNSAM